MIQLEVGKSLLVKALLGILAQMHTFNGVRLTMMTKITMTMLTLGILACRGLFVSGNYPNLLPALVSASFALELPS